MHFAARNHGVSYTSVLRAIFVLSFSPVSNILPLCLTRLAHLGSNESSKVLSEMCSSDNSELANSRTPKHPTMVGPIRAATSNRQEHGPDAVHGRKHELPLPPGIKNVSFGHRWEHNFNIPDSPDKRDARQVGAAQEEASSAHAGASPREPGQEVLQPLNGCFSTGRARAGSSPIAPSLSVATPEQPRKVNTAATLRAPPPAAGNIFGVQPKTSEGRNFASAPSPDTPHSTPIDNGKTNSEPAQGTHAVAEALAEQPVPGLPTTAGQARISPGNSAGKVEAATKTSPGQQKMNNIQVATPARSPVRDADSEGRERRSVGGSRATTSTTTA